MRGLRKLGAALRMRCIASGGLFYFETVKTKLPLIWSSSGFRLLKNQTLNLQPKTTSMADGIRIMAILLNLN
jgi:hypothetical protein